MSGLEAFGLACGVMQTIQFACETTRLCKSIYQSGQVLPELSDTASSMSAVAGKVQTLYERFSPNNKNEEELVCIAKKCRAAANSLDKEVNLLKHKVTKRNPTSILHVVFKIYLRRPRLDRLEKALDECRKTMETHLLVQVCTQQDAARIQQQVTFEKLDDDLQHFIVQSASGNTGILDMVNQEAVATRQHMSTEAHQLRNTVTGHVSEEARKTETHVTLEVTKASGQILRTLQIGDDQNRSVDERTRLLESLKDPGMNERANMLKDAHIKTFHWIFKDDVRQPWDNFPGWLKSDGKIYWISGKPGSGKSTLVKFIVSHRETADALDVWNPGTVIFRHYLWKPGSRMQNGIKGLLASVLHQAFEREERTLDHALSSNRTLKYKACHTDWSLKELKDLCVSTLENYPFSVCIFLDGLDEMPDEDVSDHLFPILDTWMKIPTVKLCVASRPEPRFHRRLHRYQHLRLQDLTASDIRALAEEARKVISPFYETQTAKARSRLFVVFELLSHRAEGVFLWLKLAITSLRRGAENGDSIEELHARLESLPGELSDLYQEMWSRLNEDEPLYRQAAARYFNLLITIDGLNERKFPHKESSALDLMAATNRELQLHFLNTSRTLPKLDIERLFEKFSLDIRVRCAGILEVSSNPTKQPESALHRCVKSKVQFIHRSAYDFIFDTEAGKQIRAADISTEPERQLCTLRADLVVVRALAGTDVVVVLRPEPLERILMALSWFVTAQQGFEAYEDRFRDEVLDILELCQAFYERGYWGKADIRAHFLARLAPYTPFHDCMVTRIRDSVFPSSLATTVLRDLAWASDFRWWRPWMYPCFQRAAASLLELDADPNAMGLCPVNEHHLVRIGACFRPYASAVTGLLAAHEYDIERRSHLALQDVLQRLLNARTDLSALTCVTVNFDTKLATSRIYQRVYFYSGDLGPFESGSFTIDSDTYGHRPEKFSIVMVVNLAYLVKRLMTSTRRHERTSGENGLEVDRSDFGIGSIAPHAESRYLIVRGTGSARRFRISRNATSEAIERLIHSDYYEQPLVSGDYGKGDIVPLMLHLIQSGGCSEIMEDVYLELARDRIGFILLDEYYREEEEKKKKLREAERVTNGDDQEEDAQEVDEGRRL